MTVRAVLDATAVMAFARGGIGVGEIIAEITDEGACFAVPDVCLIEAALRLAADEWPALHLLVGHSRCVRLPLPPDWREMATAARLLGGTARAAAMLAAVDHRAYLLTAEPEAFGGDDALLVIGV